MRPLRRPGLLLAVAAALPFLPALAEVARHGVPDLLLSGDGATLELRTFNAVHATQLLGPYSRFVWSHPGPAYFYLALPFYEALGQRGSALNVFAVISNLACSIALVESARRLRGSFFALVMAALLAAYEAVGTDFSVASEWNPVVTVLPFALLFFACARLATGTLAALPLVAFLASAVVQTHVGYLPVVASVVGVSGATAAAFAWRDRRREAPSRPWHARVGVRASILAALVVLVMWLPPVVEAVRHPPGNLGALVRFFGAAHPPDHTWRAALDAVARELARLPLALGRALGLPATGELRLARGYAVGLVIAVLGTFRVGWWRGDRTLSVLAALSAGTLVASLLAVHAVRGELHPYLLLWVSMVGLLALAPLVAASLPSLVVVLGSPRANVGIVAVAVGVLAVATRTLAQHGGVFRERDETLERLATDTERALRDRPGPPPVARPATHDAWPTAVGVMLYLVKRGVPLSVDDAWLFMMGEQLGAKAPGGPTLAIGDDTYCEDARARHDLRVVASAGKLCTVLGDPRYLEEHRVSTRLTLLSATGVRGDAGRVVDGVIPGEGTRWDSPLSVVLEDTTSALEVLVPTDPDGTLDGVFLSADGSDVYAVDCLLEGGSERALGSVLAGVPVGMGTGFVFADDLSACRAIRVRPLRGDGLYSVGEVGFLHR